MPVLIKNRKRGATVPASTIRRVAQRSLDALGLSDAELSIVIVGDRTMRLLNRTWRHKDYPTDVLSFRIEDALGATPQQNARVSLLGDIVVNADAAERQRHERGLSLLAEIQRLLVHGVVHLAGYDHESDQKEARQMNAIERRVLRAIQQNSEEL